jgi:choline transport protein
MANAAQSNTALMMYSVNNPDHTITNWQFFVTYIIITWLACPLVCFCNWIIPYVNKAGIVFVMAGFVATIIIL